MKIPTFDGIRMVEWTTGFGLMPYYRASVRCRIELNRVKVPQEGILARFFGPRRECWAVQVWESEGARSIAKPTWQAIMDRETTEDEAKREFGRIKRHYDDVDNWDEMARCFRSRTPKPNPPPGKPVMKPGQVAIHDCKGIIRCLVQGHWPALDGGRR